jgi:phage tail sheath protein FI
MAFQVSPGVQVKEVDLTNVVPAVSSTTGGFAGSFRWGPVDEVVSVSDSVGLVDTFFTPDNTDAGAEDFYSAEAFLRYGSSLRVVRVASATAYNANIGGDTDASIKNLSGYQSTHEDGGAAGVVGSFTAKYPGVIGNSLKVSVCASSDAYYNDNVTTLDEAEAAGQTVISVTAETGFQVRDIVRFGTDTQEYRVTAKATGTITVEALNQPAGTGLVTAVANATQVHRYWEFYNKFDKAPGTSASATAASGSADEIHIVVVDEDGVISGKQNEILESYGFVSCASDAKNSEGASNYYKQVVNNQSKWIWWTGHSTSTHAANNSVTTHAASGSTAFGRPSAPISSSLANGADGTLPTPAVKYAGYSDNFGDSETVDVSFLVTGSTRTSNGDIVADHNTIVNQLIQIAENRKDCMVIASPRKASVVGVTSESTQSSNVTTDFSSVTSSSYAVLDSGWVYQYDRYNDRYVWVPGNGHTAGIMARADLLRDPWYSPAGFSRGQYLGITKLAFNPSQGSRDDLYSARINPICTFPGQGTVLFGDKTALTTPSAFDRINVRRLFIVLEKAIAVAAKSQLFEFNDAFTRAQFRAAVEPFLRDVKNRRGLVDFTVLCDETNNTDSVIDRNEFVCSIFVKPARSINFITLNFVAARSGVEFEEIYGAV